MFNFTGRLGSGGDGMNVLLWLQIWCPVRARGGDMSAAAVCTYQDTAVPIQIVSAYISGNPQLLSLSPRQ